VLHDGNSFKSENSATVSGHRPFAKPGMFGMQPSERLANRGPHRFKAGLTALLRSQNGMLRLLPKAFWVALQRNQPYGNT
jgi:hypothetical protein